MKNTNQVAVGVAGGGYIANFAHLPALSKNADVKLKAICDLDLHKAEKAADRFRIPRVYSTVDEMLANESLDLVDICLPPPSHYAAIMSVLSHDVNCIVEKPLTTKTSDADEAIELSEKKGLRLNVIHNYSALPAVLKAKELVAKGRVGSVRGAHINHLNVFMQRHIEADHWVHSLPGDYFAEVGPHLAMLLVEFIGPVEKAEVVAIKTSRYNSIKLDEYGIIVRAKDSVGSISCSENCPSRALTIDVWGTAGWLHVNADYQAIVFRGSLDSSMNVWGRGKAALGDIYARGAALLSTSLRVLLGEYSAETFGHRYLLGKAISELKGSAEYPIKTRNAREAVRLMELVFGKNATNDAVSDPTKGGASND